MIAETKASSWRNHIFSAGDSPIGIIGLIERGAVHPFLIGLLCAGAAISKQKAADELLPHRQDPGRLPRPSDAGTRQ